MPASPPRPSSERRSCPRLPVFLRPYHVGILRTHGWQACPARIFDLSANGLLVHVTEPIAVGDQLRLTFTVTGNPRDLLVVDVEVRHAEQVSQRVWRAGCRIDQDPRQAEPVLAQFVESNLVQVPISA